MWPQAWIGLSSHRRDAPHVGQRDHGGWLDWRGEVSRRVQSARDRVLEMDSADRGGSPRVGWAGERPCVRVGEHALVQMEHRCGGMFECEPLGEVPACHPATGAATVVERRVTAWVMSVGWLTGTSSASARAQVFLGFRRRRRDDRVPTAIASTPRQPCLRNVTRSRECRQLQAGANIVSLSEKRHARGRFAVVPKRLDEDV